MRLKSVLAALGIACALVIGIDYVSFAATGHGLLLGAVNKETKVTTIKRTNAGPAASFVTKTGQPPFAVSSTGKVANLNADKLDGRESTSFATNQVTSVYRFTAATAATGHTFTVPVTLPAGRYLATYSVNATTTAVATAANPITFVCSFDQYPTTLHLHASGASNAVQVAGQLIGISATAVIDTVNGNKLDVGCNAAGGTSANWKTPPASSAFAGSDAMPAEITLTKLNSTTITSVTSN
ncbi:MAG TPA: hypothetical protein VHZ06_05020 [Marmoricola sp.]|jgi:hypothetical protein|nr:hypothetical protein [Marmoricola sp.]